MLNFLAAALIVYEVWRIQHHCTAADSNKVAGVVFGSVAIFGLSLSVRAGIELPQSLLILQQFSVAAHVVVTLFLRVAQATGA